MPLRDVPIRRKLMTIILLTTGIVLVLTCTSFIGYELYTFRQTAARELSTLGRIVATNSTAALAFQNRDDAHETLAALTAEPHIVAAALYDSRGRLFAHFPDSLALASAPARPGQDGYRFEQSHLVGFEPVAEAGQKRFGTLYLKADLSAVYQRLGLYSGIALLVAGLSFLAAYLISRKLQQQISAPILALAETAKAISDRGDYSVRATKAGDDELGLLTDAFNQMLSRIDEQNYALTDSEERVRAVLNSALSAVVATDVDGRITDWNTRAEAMFCLSRTDALGRRPENTIVPVSGREPFRRAVAQALEPGRGTGVSPTVEITAQRDDGTTFPAELAVSPLRRNGTAAFCCFITDITERKYAEDKVHAQLARHSLLNQITRAIGERQELQSIFEAVLGSLEENFPIDFGGVGLYDPVREVLTIVQIGKHGRPFAAAMKTLESSELAIGPNGLTRCIQGDLLYEPDTNKVAFPFAQRFAAQGLSSIVAAPLLLESQVFGILFCARRASNGFSSPDCEFIRQLSEHVALAAHQAQIYTALQRAYDDLRQTQQTVLQQERLRALGQMASGIAHDINNAISPVALYTQLLLLQEPNLSTNAREYLQTMERAIDDVAATVARMREFYRQREPDITLAPVNVNHLVKQVLQLTRAWWSDTQQQRGVVIEIDTDLAAELPSIMGSEHEIREALTNLIFNAVDAMPEGGRLTLRTRVTEGAPGSHGPPPQRVQLEVSDSGLGMDEETRRRCLEPFFTTKGERGTGLGLAMVYGTVQRHGADIEIDSTPGQGTTMRISFTVPTVVMETAQPTRAYAVPSRLRILLVDDDPMLLKSLRDTLEVDGHGCTIANGGKEGIETFRTARDGGQPFSVVITDLGMPYIDGRQVASAVKETSPSTPVLLLTGWGQRMASEGDVPAHVDRLLSKPPKLAELRDALAAYKLVPS